MHDVNPLRSWRWSVGKNTRRRVCSNYHKLQSKWTFTSLYEFANGTEFCYTQHLIISKVYAHWDSRSKMSWFVSYVCILLFPAGAMLHFVMEIQQEATQRKQHLWIIDSRCQWIKTLWCQFERSYLLREFSDPRNWIMLWATFSCNSTKIVVVCCFYTITTSGSSISGIVSQL